MHCLIIPASGLEESLDNDKLDQRRIMTLLCIFTLKIIHAIITDQTKINLILLAPLQSSVSHFTPSNTNNISLTIVQSHAFKEIVQMQLPAKIVCTKSNKNVKACFKKCLKACLKAFSRSSNSVKSVLRSF